MIEEHFSFFFPIWICKTCGRKYHGLEQFCMFCKHNKYTREKEKVNEIPRWQYRELPIQQVGRTYYEGDINIDWYRRGGE